MLTFIGKTGVVLLSNGFFLLLFQQELADLDKLREEYVTSKADEPESRDGDMLGEDWGPTSSKIIIRIT